MSRDKFAGIEIDTGRGWVTHKKDGGSLCGAHARVEAAGEIDRRITATRLILTGPFAPALRTKKDNRGLYLTVEGSGFGFVVELNPKQGADARKFAARINAVAMQVTAS